MSCCEQRRERLVRGRQRLRRSGSSHVDAADVQAVGLAPRREQTKRLAARRENAEQAAALLMPVDDLGARAVVVRRRGADLGALADRDDAEAIRAAQAARDHVDDSAARTRAARAVRRAAAPSAAETAAARSSTTAAPPRGSARRRLGERLLEQPRQALEAAVRHQHDVIAGRELVEQPREQRLHVGGDDRAASPSGASAAAGSQPKSAAPSTNTRSAAANEPCSVSRCTPMRIVFERGSMTATMRCCGARLRKPCSVVAIAVG